MIAQEHTPEELRRQIDATRRELGATVEQLAARTAVKARLRDRVERVRDDLTRPVLALVIVGVAMTVVVAWSLPRRTD